MKIAIFASAFLAGTLILVLGFEAYERHQQPLVVLAAFDPEATGINLPELKSVRALLETRLRSLETEVRAQAPDLEPGSLEVVVFPYSKAAYLALVRYHGRAFGYTVMDRGDLVRSVRRAAFEIRTDIALFLAFRRQQQQRPGQVTAWAFFLKQNPLSAGLHHIPYYFSNSRKASSFLIHSLGRRFS